MNDEGLRNRQVKMVAVTSVKTKEHHQLTYPIYCTRLDSDAGFSKRRNKF